MQHGIIAAWDEGMVTDNKSKSKFIGTEYKAESNGNKPAESSFLEKQELFFMIERFTLK